MKQNPPIFSRTSMKSGTSRRNTILCGVFFAWGILSLLIGCTGYHVGTDALFTNEIKTVFVPMAEADSYRRGLGERLTEAVCKKITTRTPFDLANASNADSVLNIRISAENQYVSAMDAYNNTRQKNLVWSVSAKWEDRRHNVLAQLDPIPLSSLGVSVNEMEYIVPEAGQSAAVSQQELIDKIADQIVSLMEVRW